jgi:hypothetical protein
MVRCSFLLEDAVTLRNTLLVLMLATAAAACQKSQPAPAPQATAEADVKGAAGAEEAKNNAAAPTPAPSDEPAKPAKPAQEQGQPVAEGGAAAQLPDQSAVAGVPLGEFPALDELPDVRVLDEGTGDKKALRYRYSPGSKHIMEMRLEMGMGMKVGEREMPPVALPAMLMRAEILVGQPEGDLMPYEFTVPTAPEVEAKEGASEAMIQGLKASLAAMTGLKGKAQVDARGATREGKFVLEGEENPQLAQLVDSMGQSMKQMSIPLPEAAVGVGARWQARQRMKMGGMSIFQVGEYALVAMDGDALTLKVTLTQLGPKQMMDPPGLPPGVTAELLDMRGTGSGTMEVNLTSLVPVSRVSVTSATSMRMTQQGAPQEMSMKMTMDMGIKPGAVQ